MAEMKLLMCCHKPFRDIPPLYLPIQCGSALNTPVEGAVSDGEGDNISLKNREYCELTAHYYAWKNISAEYYGFCHYRRFFSLDRTVKGPYAVIGALNDELRTRHWGTEEDWHGLISAHDIIAPRSEDMGISVREHYCTARYHYAEDLELFLRILEEKAPELAPDAREYLTQRRQYFCNMFIMRREYFSAYCRTLFSVLEEFDRQKSLHEGFQANRTDGYLGELFTGIYINFCRRNGADIAELPRLDNECTWKKRLGYALFPPESKRRFLAKKLGKRLIKK